MRWIGSYSEVWCQTFVESVAHFVISHNFSVLSLFGISSTLD